MAKKSTTPPWMPADDYGRSLSGFGINLLVSDVRATVAFSEAVLGADPVHADEDFAVLRLGGVEWMLHADHTYSDHPLSGFVRGLVGRGAGAELRLYALDPDDAVERARAFGATVLAAAADKPHGVREAYILDPDGYCWVPSRPLAMDGA